MNMISRRIALLFAGIALVQPLSPATVAQQPIRVETKQVLVPVSVLDKRQQQFHRAQLQGFRLYEALRAGDMKRFDALVVWRIIPDLTITDFRLYDDGKEQQIRSVSRESTIYWDLRDNKGHHTEYIGIGGGKWSTTQWQRDLIGDSLDPVHYVVGYSLPESPEGSCHKIQLKVNRPNAFVASREEYCNTHHPASDPLNGSQLGALLESELTRAVHKGFELSVLATQYHYEGEAARVHIAVDWHGKAIKNLSNPNGIVGMIFNQDGTIVTRFSDLADRNGGLTAGISFTSSSDATESTDANQFPDENRYETQVNLAPGEYELRVALGDGKKFGKAIVPLSIKSPNHNELTISQISLCKLVSDVSVNAQRLPGTWTLQAPDYAPLLSNETEFQPTADTRFRLGESLYTYFEVYKPQGEGSENGAVEIEIRITDLKDGRIISDPQPINVAPHAKPGSSTIPIGRGVDISRVPKGSYRIEVRAVGSRGTSTAWHRADFTIE